MDILIVNVPSISLVYPPAAPSLLKGVCEKAGYSAQVKDFNLQLFTSIDDPEATNRIDNYFTIQSNKVTEEDLTTITSWYDSCIQQIQSINPKFLGISVFTFECQRATEELLARLRPVWSGKVIVGGAGLSTTGIASEKNDFGTRLKQQGLVDFFVRGEGENALLNILRNNDNVIAGINNDNYEQLTDLDSIAFPNYDDIIDLPYKYSNDIVQLPVTTSRGCVRRCTFCDIHAFWKKYTYRSGENVAAEMIQHYEKYGVRHFFFTDSLINGSLKSFRDLCKRLNDYYSKNNLGERFFHWGGQWIVRTPSQLSPEDYASAARSGMNGLAMGIESLSQNVRNDMNKGFLNSDLDYTLEQFRANNMNCYFLLIVGYPTETEADFHETLEQFTKYQGYAIDGTIFGVNLGGTLSIDEGTPLHINGTALGLEFSTETGNEKLFGLDWVNENNPGLTLLERCKRRVLIQELLMDLGYTVWNGDHQLTRLRQSYDKITRNSYNSPTPSFTQPIQ
jgi:hypothetical protein